MKNQKMIIGGVCAVVAVAAVVGVLLLGNANDSSDADNSGIDASQEVANANYTIVETMQKVKPTNTQEEITEIVGFEPTVDAMIGSDPIWKFDKNNWISYKTSSDGKVTVQATIDKESLKDENIQFPSASDLQKDLNNGSFTYEELVKKVGGEGTLTTVSTGSKSYTWVDKNGQKLGATFNGETGKCTVASYRQFKTESVIKNTARVTIALLSIIGVSVAFMV